MGPKQSKDFLSDTSDGGQNASTGAGSGSSNSASKVPVGKGSPTTYNGAFVGVSTSFKKPEKLAAKSSVASSQRSSTPQQQRRGIFRRMVTSNEGTHQLPKFNDDTEIEKARQKERNTMYARGGVDRVAFLRKLGFDEKRKEARQTMNPSVLLISSSTMDVSNGQQPDMVQRQPTLSATTVVPESKFTQILQANIKSAAGTETRNELVAATEVAPAVIKPSPPMNAIERALQKHAKAQETAQELPQKDDPCSLTYQEIPADYMEANSGSAEEEENKNNKRQTEKVPLKIDESLFLDKIKAYQPVNLSQEQIMSEVSEAEAEDEPAEFDITQVEENKDDSVLPSDVRNAEIEPAVDGIQEEDNRQEGFRLDNMSRDRKGDQLRKNLLSKLTYEKIWLTPMQKPKPYETAIIFDWDDTLLCTSFINPQGVYQHVDLGPVVQQHIRLLEQTSKRMLELAVKYGRVYIITNAAEGWVEFSCQRFMPEVLPVLDKITIISARARYESRFPGDVPKWKLYAFLETQTELINGNMKNVVALGDSMMEMDAAHHLAMKFQKALIKTVKFREFPKPNELVKQLNLVITKFDDIINNVRNLTIRLEKKQGQK